MALFANFKKVFKIFLSLPTATRSLLLQIRIKEKLVILSYTLNSFKMVEKTQKEVEKLMMEQHRNNNRNISNNKTHKMIYLLKPKKYRKNCNKIKEKLRVNKNRIVRWVQIRAWTPQIKIKTLTKIKAWIKTYQNKNNKTEQQAITIVDNLIQYQNQYSNLIKRIIKQINRL